MSDEELRDTLDSYVNTPPGLQEVLLKTPVGPVIFINILFYVTGFSWCDVPWADPNAQACIQLAERVGK